MVSGREVALLDRCTKEYLAKEEFHNDRRYLRLWMWYADTFPRAMSSFFFSKKNHIHFFVVDKKIFFVLYRAVSVFVPLE